MTLAYYSNRNEGVAKHHHPPTTSSGITPTDSHLVARSFAGFCSVLSFLRPLNIFVLFRRWSAMLGWLVGLIAEVEAGRWED